MCPQVNNKPRIRAVSYYIYNNTLNLAKEEGNAYSYFKNPSIKYIKCNINIFNEYN